MSRETIEQKAARYLGEGRLTITYVRTSTPKVSASCRGGEGSVYSLGYAHGGYFCSCPARVVECAHVRALQLVTPVPL